MHRFYLRPPKGELLWPSSHEAGASGGEAPSLLSGPPSRSMCNLQPTSSQDRDSVADLDSQLQEQERIINISYALASEASQRSKQVAGEVLVGRGQPPRPAPSLLLGLRAQHGLSGSQGKKRVSSLVVEGQWCIPLSSELLRACTGDGQGRRELEGCQRRGPRGVTHSKI